MNYWKLIARNFIQIRSDSFFQTRCSFNVSVILFLGVRLGLMSSADVGSASMTAGLVQEYEHHLLPSVKPLLTLVCTVAATVVSNSSGGSILYSMRMSTTFSYRITTLPCKI